VAGFGHLPAELGEVAREPGVDEDQAAGLIDQVKIDHVVAQAVNTRSDLLAGTEWSGTGHGFSSRGDEVRYSQL
jgi:hypothetical protein